MATRGAVPVQPPAVDGDAAAKSQHLRSLDGLRAISIALVLLDHMGRPWDRGPLDLGIGDYGTLGVVVFFVISGFLITSLLMTEHARKGRVSLRLFYARRALRIFPAAYVFLLAVFLLWLAGRFPLAPRDFGYALTYTVNYLPRPGWQIGHLWSLSVEEQFYLLWPLAFVALGLRRAAWVAAVVVLVGPAARAGARVFLRGSPYEDLPMFPMVADSLAVGCLLAVGRGWLERQGWYLALLRPGFSLFLVGLVLLLNRYTGYGVVDVAGRSVLNVALAILVHRSVHHSWDRAGRFLNWRPVAFVGLLSYSFYLWQQLFLDRHSTSWVNLFPQNLLLAFAAALGSYYLLEKPLMALRHRLRAS
jgi:peptidoglycan/LPS O-acetylase OafA/YrhL